MFELAHHYGWRGLVQGIWKMICLFIRSFLNKTDVLIEYQKECDKMSQKLRECLEETDEGRELLAKADVI
jgi:hypothetical protein